MNRLIAIPLGILAFAIFCFFCLRAHGPMIQQDVMTRTANVLSQNGIPVSGLSVNGRDVLLSGVAGSPIVSNRTRSLAEGVDGVRIVNVNVTTATAQSSAVIPADAEPDAKLKTLKVETQQKLNTLLKENIVEFSSGSAELTDAGRNTLDQIAAILGASPALECDINGYTDSAGDSQMNMDLSDRRASASKDYLVSKGISSDRLVAAGFGAANPIASNNSEEGRRKNRRIEFLLKEKQ